jgi:DNA-binding FadR family transcriptional regulator
MAKMTLARDTLAEQVASYMRAHIARNHLRPGDPTAAEDAMTAIALGAAAPRHQAHD